MERTLHLTSLTMTTGRWIIMFILFVMAPIRALAFEITCPQDKWVYYEDLHYLDYEKPYVKSYYNYHIYGPWLDEHVHCQEGHIKVTWKIVDHYNKTHYCYQTIYVKPRYNTNHGTGLTIECPKEDWVYCDELHYIKYEQPKVWGYHDDYEIHGPYVKEHLDQCGQGKVIVTWKIADACGKWYECTYWVWVKPRTGAYGSPVKWWPKDFETTDCEKTHPEQLPKFYNYPIYHEHVGCAKLAYSFRDEIFYPWGDAAFCYKILRTWTVIDWCTYNPHNNHYGYGNHGHDDGIWTYEQVIKVVGGHGYGPELECPDDITVDVDGHETEAYVDLDKAKAWASDSGCSDKVTITNDSKYADDDGADASGHYPIGVHWVTFKAFDGCHNEVKCKVKITVVDKIPPTPYCLHGIVTSIGWHSDGVYTLLDPKKFDAGSYDNITPKNKLKFSISPKKLTCENLDTNTVYITITDEFGNSAVCTTYVILQDNLGMCPKDTTVGNFTISGNITTEGKLPVANALVTFEQTDHKMSSVTTTTQGAYTSGKFNAQDKITIIPSKEVDMLEGVNSQDYIALFNHVTGKELITSPYKLLAADINGDNKLDIQDVFELGNLILLKGENTPDHMHSWRFVDAHYQFKNPANPFSEAITGTMSVSNLKKDMKSMDFIGIKMGDLNGTLSASQSLELREAGINLELSSTYEVIQNRKVVTLTTDNPGLHQGAWMELSAKGSAIHAADGPGQIVKVDDNTIRILWNSADHGTLTDLKITLSNRQGSLMLTAEGEAVDKNGKLGDLVLSETHGKLSVQLSPNPITHRGELYYQIGVNQAVTLQIIDVHGQLIQTIHHQGQRGWNRISLDASSWQQAGVFIYHLATEEGRISGKILKID